jgi:CheY-like chemotaxis protein
MGQNGGKYFVSEVSTQRKGKSVLIVDDTPANLQLLISVLQITGLEVRPVLTGEMALRAAEAAPPDLILLDTMLPGISGYEVCTALKANPALRHIPVIFLSALGSETEKKRAFEVGGAGYITKPFQIDDVLRTIAQVMNALE